MEKTVRYSDLEQSSPSGSKGPFLLSCSGLIALQKDVLGRPWGALHPLFSWQGPEFLATILQTGCWNTTPAEEKPMYFQTPWHPKTCHLWKLSSWLQMLQIVSVALKFWAIIMGENTDVIIAFKTWLLLERIIGEGGNCLEDGVIQDCWLLLLTHSKSPCESVEKSRYRHSYLSS